MKCAICNEETIGTVAKMWGCDFAHVHCIKAYSLGKNDTAALAAQPGQDAVDAERLVWAMNHMNMPQYSTAFVHHVLSVGGIGDLSDCRVFVDAAISAKKGG